MSSRPILLLALGAALGSCYEYVPARSPAALVGRHVQLQLTDSGAVVLASRIGPSVEVIEGTLLADSAGSYQVAVLVTHTRAGSAVDWRGEPVTVSHALVTSFAEQRFSPSRTLFASGLAAAGVVGVTVGLRGSGKSSGGDPTGGKPPVQ